MRRLVNEAAFADPLIRGSVWRPGRPPRASRPPRPCGPAAAERRQGAGCGAARLAGTQDRGCQRRDASGADRLGLGFVGPRAPRRPRRRRAATQEAGRGRELPLWHARQQRAEGGGRLGLRGRRRRGGRAPARTLRHGRGRRTEPDRALRLARRRPSRSLSLPPAPSRSFPSPTRPGDVIRPAHRAAAGGCAPGTPALGVQAPGGTVGETEAGRRYGAKSNRAATEGAMFPTQGPGRDSLIRPPTVAQVLEGQRWERLRNALPSSFD